MKSDSFDKPDRHSNDRFDSIVPGGDNDASEGFANAAPSPSGASAEGDEPNAGEQEMVQECLDPNVQSRLWLRAIVPLLQLRTHETDPSGRVQFAFDLMYIAACERIARILRSDLPASQE
jgi:hypothetical protein